MTALDGGKDAVGVNWRRALNHLHIDAYVTHAGITVVRVGNNRYLVLQDGYTTHIGGGRMSQGMAIAHVLEEITGMPQPLPCAKCLKPREVSSYCREHYNQMHIEPNRRRNAKRKAIA